jgi:hypothetical protein
MLQKRGMLSPIPTNSCRRKQDVEFGHDFSVLNAIRKHA